MQALIPAIVGGVVLLVGLIVWKYVITPMQEKKRKALEEAEKKRRDEERRDFRHFFETRVLPRIPTQGGISFDELRSLLSKEEENLGGVFGDREMRLLQGALNRTGLGKNEDGEKSGSAYLIFNGTLWCLTSKGLAEKAQKVPA